LLNRIRIKITACYNSDQQNGILLLNTKFKKKKNLSKTF
jgi:hypothetical protein